MYNFKLIILEPQSGTQRRVEGGLGIFVDERRPELKQSHVFWND